MQHHSEWHWDSQVDQDGNTAEAVAVFENEMDMEEAVQDLELHGFNHAAMSGSAPADMIAENLGHPITSIREIEDDCHVPREDIIDTHSRFEGRMVLILGPAYALGLFGLVMAVSKSMLTIEILLVMMLFAFAGAGFGGLIVRRQWLQDKKRRQEDKRLGGRVLWVRIGNRIQGEEAMRILKAHAGRDVHLHGPAF